MKECICAIKEDEVCEKRDKTTKKEVLRPCKKAERHALSERRERTGG